jgi:type II secretory pathway component PulF
VLLAGSIGLLILNTVPQFREMFDSYEASLPFYTDLVLATYKYYGLLAFVGVATGSIAALCRLDAKESYAVMWCVIGGFAIVIALFVFTIFAMYRPILLM